MATRASSNGAVTASRKRPKAQEHPADLQAAGKATWDLLWNSWLLLDPTVGRYGLFVVIVSPPS
jgi:hypothetical protein